MRSKKRLVFGYGINDANYPVTSFSKEGKRETCPFYVVWVNMLKRCYCSAYRKDRPSYKDVLVCDDWLRFSNFKAWMETQDWKGKQLDKDLLVEGNKVYSPDTCVFISHVINSFILDSAASRGEFPIGVSWNARAGKFTSYCNNPFSGKREHLGSFQCPNAAHKRWAEKKFEFAKMLAQTQTDRRVADSLLGRYKISEP